MGILSLASGLNWIRIALIAGLAVAIFGMGYLYAGQKHAEREAEFQKEVTAAVDAREKELKAEFKVRLGEEEIARADLQNDRDAIRTHRDELIAGIRRAQLTKPVADITVEACLETDDENVQVIVGNPFDPTFVGLWNDGSRGLVGVGEDTGPETD